jgi:hypothetical protein
MSATKPEINGPHLTLVPDCGQPIPAAILDHLDDLEAHLGWLKAEGDPQIVRTYYLDLPACERIVERARAARGNHVRCISGGVLAQLRVQSAGPMA